MHLFPTLQVFAFLAVSILNDPCSSAEYGQLSLSQLEDRQDAIEDELTKLPAYSLRTGGNGSIGYRATEYSTHPPRMGWVEIALAKKVPIDEIVVVPTLWHFGNQGYLSAGFPEAFQIVVGAADDRKGSVIAKYDSKDQLLPRIAPLVIPTHKIAASWVRLEVLKLNTFGIGHKHRLQLAEIFIFSGNKNVALHQAVTSDTKPNVKPGWASEYLVDGFTPYVMDSAKGLKSQAFYSGVKKVHTLELDLEHSYPISRIHLHAIDQNKSIPQEYSPSFGIPQQLKIEGATRADFSDATTLLRKQFKNFSELGPIMMWNITKTHCRYIRITGSFRGNSKSSGDFNNNDHRIGFAEIELYAGNQNVALHKTAPKPNTYTANYARRLAALTDGHNLYGKILPQRAWLKQLAQRHDLEKELPLITGTLKERYSKQQTLVRRLSWLAALLASGIAMFFLTHKILMMRQANNMKQRFAADLHDELGANLHAIGILGTYAKDLLNSPEKQARTLDEITSLTKRAGDSTKHFVDLHLNHEIHGDLLVDMQRTARRIVANLKYTFNAEGEEFLKNLSPRDRSDLFLFFNESLININRHANASEVNIKLIADSRKIYLAISDNGCGIEEEGTNAIPSSLQRRAKLLGAKVSIESSEELGTKIALTLKPFGIYRSRTIRIIV